MKLIERVATKRIPWAWVLGAVSAIGAVTLLAVSWNDAWVESHPGAAAWVQALGTVLAVFIALTAPHMTALIDRHQRARRQREIDLEALWRHGWSIFHIEDALEKSKGLRDVKWHSGVLGAAAYGPRRFFMSLKIAIPLSLEFAEQESGVVSMDIAVSLRAVSTRVVGFNSTLARLMDAPPAQSAPEWAAQMAEVEDAHFSVDRSIAAFRIMAYRYDVDLSRQEKFSEQMRAMAKVLAK